MKKRGPSKQGDRGTPIPRGVIKPAHVRRKRSMRSFTRPAIGVAAVVFLGLLIAGVVGGSDNGGKKAPHRAKGGGPAVANAHAPGSAGTTAGTSTVPSTATSTTAQVSSVSVQLRSTADVWVCLIDDRGRRLVNSETLTANETRGPFDGTGFQLGLGNGSIQMTVNGQPAKVPPTSSPIGFRIDTTGVHKLSPSSRPDCL
jgi:hypothetical protein